MLLLGMCFLVFTRDVCWLLGMCVLVFTRDARDVCPGFY